MGSRKPAPAAYLRHAAHQDNEAYKIEYLLLPVKRSQKQKAAPLIAGQIRDLEEQIKKLQEREREITDAAQDQAAPIILPEPAPNASNPGKKRTNHGGTYNVFS